MTRLRPWQWGLGLTTTSVVALWLAFLWWLPNDRAMADRLVAEVQNRLGVKLTVGALHWQLFPQPMLVLENVRTTAPPEVVVDQLKAYPAWLPLLRQQLVLNRVDIHGAVLPQVSLRGLSNPAATPGAGAGLALNTLRFRNLTWVPRVGEPLPLDGEVAFGADGWPSTVDLRRTGFTPQTHLRLQRQPDGETTSNPPAGTTRRWQTELEVGGGTANGEVALQTPASGPLRLTGQLQPRDVEIESALATLKRESPIHGKVSGETELSATADSPVGLMQALQTSTRFSMANATLLRFDLDKAVRSAGTQTTGQTPLNSVTGHLATRNTPQGMVATYTDLKASSGALTASGQATLANRRINAELAVDLVDGIVGVPLVVSGPTQAPQLSVPAGAVAGAVVGTAVLPGVGTAIGARVGASIGKLFSPGAEANPASAKASAPRRR